MNAGFSNLEYFKNQLLAVSLQNDLRFDAALLAIGQGVAAQIEKFCRRQFCYQANVQEIIAADRVEFMLSVYPVQSVALIELKHTEERGWHQLDAPPWQLVRTFDLGAGIVHFGDLREDVGPYWAQVRFTYAGGYWWQTLEPKDPAFNPAPPAGVPCLPAAVHLAWLTQSRKVWEAMDKVGDKILEVGSNTRQPSEALAGLDLVPLVREMLAGYVHYQIA